MSSPSAARTPDYPASQDILNSHGLSIGEVIPHLVGHTVDEVERELILHTLIRYHGSRTQSARIFWNFNPVHTHQDL